MNGRALVNTVLIGLLICLGRMSKCPLVRAGSLESPRIVQGFVVDNRHLALFEQIPPEYIDAARNLKMLFSDRSVGQNISEGLDCLTASSWTEAPAHCRRDYYDEWDWKTYTEADLLAGLVPERILFDPDPNLYSRSNWTFEYRAGSWEELTCDFVNSLVPNYVDSTDVLSYEFSYLNVADYDDIADPDVGFFANRPDHCDIGDIDALINQYPDKVFVFWTTSLARGIGTDVSTEFNDQMRQYCLQNDRILLDVADILSHTEAGECYDNRDGVPYVAMNGASEDYPDDGFDYPAICQDYTTEVDGGHLGSVSAGKIRIAKAIWVLMARIAGWNPEMGCVGVDGIGDVDIDDVVYLIDYIFLTGPPPSPEICCGDVDASGGVDIDDAVYVISYIFTGGPTPSDGC